MQAHVNEKSKLTQVISHCNIMNVIASNLKKLYLILMASTGCTEIDNYDSEFQAIGQVYN